jgi:hypothetical protein
VGEDGDPAGLALAGLADIGDEGATVGGADLDGPDRTVILREGSDRRTPR